MLADQQRIQEISRSIVQSYEQRIDEIALDAILDGVYPHQESEQDMRDFLASIPYAQKANIVLGDTGNFRTVWERYGESRLGIEFMGNGIVQFVILHFKEPMTVTSYVTGRGSFDQVRRVVRADKLEEFLGI